MIGTIRQERRLARLDEAREFEEEAMDMGTTGFPASCVSYLLANAEDPAERWRQSWHALSQRRTAWRQTKVRRDGPVPVVASGIAALDWLCSEADARRIDPGKLWRVLFDAVRECRFKLPTCPSVSRTTSGDCSLGILHDPNAKKAPERNSPYSELLATDLNALGGDDVLVAACCEFAYRNGATASASDVAARRGQGLCAASNSHQEVERNARKNPDLAKAVNKMRMEIDAAAVDHE